MSHFTPSLRAALLAVAFGLPFVSGAHAQTPARTVSDTVPLEADGEVAVNNHEGSITVTTWGRPRVRYEAEIMSTDADPHAEKVTIRTRTTGDRFELATDHEDGDDESVVFGFDEDGFRWGGINIPAVHYTLKVPRTATLQIDDHESAIDVTGLAGRLQVHSHEGRIAVVNQRGDITIDSHESPISLRDHQGDATIETHEERIKVRRINGQLSVDTHDSDLVAETVDGQVRFESHDGAARIDFATLSASVFADTHDGDVHLTIPVNTGFRLDTDLDDDADVVSDFDLRPLRIGDGDDEDANNYRGAIHGGGPEIQIESQDGDLSLRSR